ncbi:hypothetical protein [Saccharicrinis sp. FJH54]|uniref:hypothetical protein n=1 Tax=Saccharicrinis sp. FJH54 TaxID=3344665 RepID=UPI0035D4AA89
MSLTGIVLLSACENLNQPAEISQGDAFVAFTMTSAVVSEVNSEINIPVKVSAFKGAQSIEVTFDFDTAGVANPAIEGEDFVLLNSSKKLTVSDGYGYDTIKIKTIDNDLFTGQKTVKINLVSNSLGYNFGADDVLELGIRDDDHPLGWMLGDYDVAVTQTANGSNSFSATIVPVEGETSLVKIYGLCGPPYGPTAEPPKTADDFDYSLQGTVSDDFTTITIKTGQEWDSWGYGPTSFTAWQDDNGELDEVEELVGTISTDAGVVITFSQQFTFMITSGNNEGLGLQWAWNDDAETNSPTAILTLK